jgi:putative lipoic acid-binding regulatory protein
MSKFKELLDQEYQWPARYTFKFVVPTEHLEILVELLEKELITTRESKAGKYTSVTYVVTMLSSDHVLGVYEEVKHIPGLISL